MYSVVWLLVLDGGGGGVVTNWSGWEVKEVTFKDNYYLGGGGGGDFILELPLFMVYYGVFMVYAFFSGSAAGTYIHLFTPWTTDIKSTYWQIVTFVDALD